MDLNRNMLATLYLRDPYRFHEQNDEVKKVLWSNIAWPKGYIPEDHPIKKPPPKKTKEEIDSEARKERNHVKLKQLDKMFLEEEITNLQKVAHTKDAFVTYKKAGWKTSFNKIKGVSIEKQMKEQLKLRRKCEQELPPNLREKVRCARLGLPQPLEDSRNLRRGKHKTTDAKLLDALAQTAMWRSPSGNMPGDMSAQYTSAVDFAILEDEEEHFHDNTHHEDGNQRSSDQRHFGRIPHIESIQKLNEQQVDTPPDQAYVRPNITQFLIDTSEPQLRLQRGSVNQQSRPFASKRNSHQNDNLNLPYISAPRVQESEQLSPKLQQTDTGFASAAGFKDMPTANVNKTLNVAKNKMQQFADAKLYDDDNSSLSDNDVNIERGRTLQKKKSSTRSIMLGALPGSKTRKKESEVGQVEQLRQMSKSKIE